MNLTDINYFLLDNNLLWWLLKDGTPEQKKIPTWNKYLVTWGICPTPRSVTFIATPFSFLECVKPRKSIEAPSITIDSKTIASKDVGKVQLEIYEKAYKFYSQIEWLQADKLRAASTHQKTFATDAGKEFYESVVEHNLKNDSFVESLWSALAMDHVHKSERYGLDELNWNVNLLLDLARSPAHGHRISLARTPILHFRSMESHVDPKTKEKVDLFIKTGMKSETKRRLFENVALKEHGDHLDSEIINFAVSGYLADGRLHKVACFTADANKQRIIDRIFAYKSTLVNAYERYNYAVSLNSKLPKAPDYNFGHVFICNSYGEMLDHIDVSKVEGIDD